MSGDPRSVDVGALEQGVRSVIAEVLFVAEDDVQPAKELIADLGAESIDFLDLVFRLEELIGKKITVPYFDKWIRARLAEGGDRAVTVAILYEFTVQEAGAHP